MSVKAKQYRNAHFLAICNVCEFEKTIGTDGTAAQIRQMIRQHVKKTGHKVVLDTSVTTHYSFEGELSQEDTNQWIDE